MAPVKSKTPSPDAQEFEQAVTRALSEFAKTHTPQKHTPNYWHHIISGLIIVIIAVGGGMIQQNAANSARDVKIDDLTRRITGLEQNTASKSDLEALRNYLTSTLSEIQADVKELRSRGDRQR